MITALISEWTDAQLKGPPKTAELYEQLLSIVESSLLEQAFQQCGGRYSQAARKLSLHGTTLRKKLEQYKIE